MKFLLRIDVKLILNEIDWLYKTMYIHNLYSFLNKIDLHSVIQVLNCGTVDGIQNGLNILSCFEAVRKKSLPFHLFDKYPWLTINLKSFLIGNSSFCYWW